MAPLPPELYRPLRALSQAWEGIEIMGEAAAVDQVLSQVPPSEVPDWLPPLLARILRARSHRELENCRQQVLEYLQAEYPPYPVDRS